MYYSVLSPDRDKTLATLEKNIRKYFHHGARKHKKGLPLFMRCIFDPIYLHLLSLYVAFV